MKSSRLVPDFGPGWWSVTPVLMWCCSSWVCLGEGPDCFCLLSLKSVHQQDAGQYWCEVDLHGQTLSSNPAWITVEGGTLDTEPVWTSWTSSLTSVPLLLQESLTSSRNLRTCPCFLMFPSTSPVLLLVLQDPWRSSGGSLGSRWDHLDHLPLSCLSQVREPSSVPVNHG